jgi:hypothetical protein
MVLWNWDKRIMIGTEETRLAAEEIFDEMLEAEEKLDYQSFVKRFGKKDIDNFGESRFTKDRCAIRTDLGVYKSREFLGALNGLVHTDNASMHPGCILDVSGLCGEAFLKKMRLLSWLECIKKMRDFMQIRSCTTIKILTAPFVTLPA